MDEGKSQINDLEHKEAKKQLIRTRRKKKSKKIEDSISSLWENFKHKNIHIIGVPEEEKEQETGNLFEKIMKENYSNLVKEIDIQVQEAQRVPNKMDAKGPPPRHIIAKMPKVKYIESLKSRERKPINYL